MLYPGAVPSLLRRGHLDCQGWGTGFLGFSYIPSGFAADLAQEPYSHRPLIFGSVAASGERLDPRSLPTCP